MRRPEADEFLPLPFFPWIERPQSIPLDVEEAATALFLENGDVGRAAERLRMTVGQLNRVIRKSPRLAAAHRRLDAGGKRMIARYQRRPRVGRRMCGGHKLAVDAGVGADGRRSTMTSTRSRSFQFTLSRSFPLTLASKLSRSFPLKRGLPPTLDQMMRTASTRSWREQRQTASKWMTEHHRVRKHPINRTPPNARNPAVKPAHGLIPHDGRQTNSSARAPHPGSPDCARSTAANPCDPRRDPSQPQRCRRNACSKRAPQPRR